MRSKFSQLFFCLAISLAFSQAATFMAFAKVTTVQNSTSTNQVSTSANISSQSPACGNPQPTGFCSNSASPACPQGEMQYQTQCRNASPIFSCHPDPNCDVLECPSGFELTIDETECKMSRNNQCHVDSFMTDWPIRNISGANDDVSGVAFSPETQTLFFVDNRNSDIYEMSLDGIIIRRIYTPGIEFDDIEGITHVSGMTFAFVEEKRGTLNVFTMPPSNVGTLSLNDVQQYDLFGSFNNYGLEGVVYHPGRDKYYIVKEANPKKIYEVTITAGSSNATVTELFDANNLPCQDFGGMTLNPAYDSLLIICKADKRLWEVTFEGTPVVSKSIAEFHLPEGVTTNETGDTIYVVGEPRQYSRYSNANCENQFTRLIPKGSNTHMTWLESRHFHNFDVYGYNFLNSTEYPVIAGDSFSQYAPVTSDILSVWVDARNGNNDVFAVDLLDQVEYTISTNSANQNSADVWQNRIVWQDNRNGNQDIYYCEFNMTTKACPEVQITSDLANQVSPKINGDVITWEDMRHGYSQVYYHDLTTSQTQRVSPTNYRQELPVVSPFGIAWLDSRDQGWFFPYIKHVYYYHFLNGMEQRITQNGAIPSNLSIYGSFLTWSDQRAGQNNSDIYGYLIPYSREVQITTDLSNQNNPTVVGHNRWIFWEDRREGNPNIFGKPIELP